MSNEWLAKPFQLQISGKTATVRCSKVMQRNKRLVLCLSVHTCHDIDATLYVYFEPETDAETVNDRLHNGLNQEAFKDTQPTSVLDTPVSNVAPVKRNDLQKQGEKVLADCGKCPKCEQKADSHDSRKNADGYTYVTYQCPNFNCIWYGRQFEGRMKII